MEFNDLWIFVVIVDVGSFMVVVDQLMLFKQFVSWCMMVLEVLFGVWLLYWNMCNFVVIELGQEFYVCVQCIFVEIVDVEQVMLVCSIELYGLLKISVLLLFGIMYVLLLIVEFLFVYLVVWLNFDLIDWCVDLIGEGFDFVLWIGLFEDLMLIVCLLGVWWMVVCVSFVYLKWYGMLQMLVDFVGYMCVLYGCEWWVGWEFCVDGVVWMFDVQGLFVVNNGEVVCDVVIVGFGIVLLLYFIIGVVFDSGVFVLVFDVYVLLFIMFNVVFLQYWEGFVMLCMFIGFFVEWFVELVLMGVSGVGWVWQWVVLW